MELDQIISYLTHSNVLGFLFGVSFPLAVYFIARRLDFFGSSRPTPISHKIAVLGLPTAGKTTLITAMFELIQKGMPNGDVRLHGTDTIYAVNRNVMQLASGDIIGPAPGLASANVNKLMSGNAIGPTLESDTFVFRFSYVRKSNPFRKTFFDADAYDVEIADFPGEYTERIETEIQDQQSDTFLETHRDFGGALFKREFFSWIASSREYIFLVDLAQIYSATDVRKAIAEITARIRTSWQVIEDATSDRGIGNPRNRPVHLVFSKMDALTPILSTGWTFQQFSAQKKDMVVGDQVALETKAAIKEVALRRDLSNLQDIPALFVESIKEVNQENFEDLISFFRAQVRVVDAIYCSMVIRDEQGNRLGVAEILHSTLP